MSINIKYLQIDRSISKFQKCSFFYTNTSLKPSNNTNHQECYRTITFTLVFYNIFYALILNNGHLEKLLSIYGHGVL